MFYVNRRVCKLVDGLLNCGLITLQDMDVRSYLQEFTSPHHDCCFINNSREKVGGYYDYFVVIT